MASRRRDIAVCCGGTEIPAVLNLSTEAASLPAVLIRSLQRKPIAQNTERFEPGNRDVDAVGAQIIEPAADQVIAHRGLRVRWPTRATAFQFEKHHLPIGS